jgi:hypothetical protein
LSAKEQGTVKRWGCRFAAGVFFLAGALAHAQDEPYFVTYSHELEDAGTLGIETKAAVGKPEGGNQYGASTFELEYGVLSRWQTELYLDGQATGQDSAVFTGFRFENRIRPLLRNLPVNPAIEIEYENLTGADKTMIDVVGHDDDDDLVPPNRSLSMMHQHELELRLILGSNWRNWNISENFISEKDFGHAPWEFGYAVAVSRPFRSGSAEKKCIWCVDKLTGGLEAYGGLGDSWQLTMRDTSHYLAPLIGWQLPRDTRLNFSVGIGNGSPSLDIFYRVGLSVDFDNFGARFLHLPKSHPPTTESE